VIHLFQTLHLSSFVSVDSLIGLKYYNLLTTFPKGRERDTKTKKNCILSITDCWINQLSDAREEKSTGTNFNYEATQKPL